MDVFKDMVAKSEAESIAKVLRENVESIGGEITCGEGDGQTSFTFCVGGNVVEVCVGDGVAVLRSSWKIPTSVVKTQVAYTVCQLNLCLDSEKIAVNFETSKISLISSFCYADSLFGKTALLSWEKHFADVAEIIAANIDNIARGQNSDNIADALCETSSAGDRNSALDCLKKFSDCVNKRGWKALSEDGNLFLNMWNDNRCVNLSFTYNYDYSCVLVTGVFPLNFENSKSDCALNVCMLNEKLQHGCLDFDAYTAEVYYRYSLPTAGSLVSESLCSVITDICCEEMFEVYERLERISHRQM